MFWGSVLVKLKKKLLIGAGISGALVLLTSVAAGAQDVDPVQAVTDLGIQLNMLWVVIGAVLVIFMQAGFALSRPASAGPSTPRTWSRPTSRSSASASSGSS